MLTTIPLSRKEPLKQWNMHLLRYFIVEFLKLPFKPTDNNLKDTEKKYAYFCIIF